MSLLESMQIPDELISLHWEDLVVMILKARLDLVPPVDISELLEDLVVVILESW